MTYTLMFYLLCIVFGLVVGASVVGLWMQSKYLPRHRRPEHCHHMFFPEYDESNRAIGQRCSLCGHFNSLAEVEAMWREANPKGPL